MGVTLPGSLASPTAVRNPVLIDATGLPLNSTKQFTISFRSFQRRRCASSRGGTGAGVRRFLDALSDCLAVKDAALKVDE
jgi:hypothetical protein